jgi:hypothetical protein
MTAASEDMQPSIIVGTVMAPLLGVTFKALPEEVAVSADIRVVPRTAVAVDFGNWDTVPETDNQTLASATHVVELPNVTLLTWPDEPAAPQLTEETRSRLDDVMAMLSLSARGFVGHAEIAIIAPADVPEPIVDSFLLREFASRLDAATKFTPKELSAGQLAESIDRWRKLPARHPSLRTAAQRLLNSWVRERDSHDRIVDLCIAIEALVGEGANELVNRISLRTAAMLATAGWHPSSETAKGIRDIYSYRSQVVHGIAAPYKKEMITMSGDSPVHAVRYALAVLVGLLEIYFTDGDLTPDRVDERFIFAAFDLTAATTPGVGAGETQ